MAKSKKTKSNLISAAMFIIVGVVLAIMGGGALNIALTIAGAIFLIFGIVDAVKKNIASGIVSIVIGLVLLICAWTPLIKWLMIILGVLIIIKGVVALIGALSGKKKSILDIVFAVVTIVAGLLLIFAFGEIADIFIRIGGVLLIVNGILELLGKSLFKK